MSFHTTMGHRCPTGNRFAEPRGRANPSFCWRFHSSPTFLVAKQADQPARSAGSNPQLLGTPKIDLHALVAQTFQMTAGKTSAIEVCANDNIRPKTKSCWWLYEINRNPGTPRLLFGVGSARAARMGKNLLQGRLLAVAHLDNLDSAREFDCIVLVCILVLARSVRTRSSPNSNRRIPQSGSEAATSGRNYLRWPLDLSVVSNAIRRSAGPCYSTVQRRLASDTALRFSRSVAGSGRIHSHQHTCGGIGPSP